MERRATAPFFVHDADQIRAVASPIRGALLDALEVIGPATIVELAEALGYPPDGLYYHFAVLERHGLVRRAEPAEETGAARFDVPGRPVTLRYRLPDRRQRRATTGMVGAMVRSAERSFHRAFVPGLATVQGPCRNLRAGRRAAWLTPVQLRALNRCLERIHALFGRGVPRRKGARLHEFTYVLAPLVGNGRRGTERSSRKRGRK